MTRLLSRLAALPAFVVVLVTMALVLVPIGVGIFMSLRSAPIGVQGEFTLDNYAGVLTNSQAGPLILNTAIMTVTAAGGGTILGLLLAWIITQTDVPGARYLYFLPMAPTLLPGLLKTVGWITLYSPRSGLVNFSFQEMFGFSDPVADIYSLPGLIVVLMLAVTPITYFLMLGPAASMGRSLEEASRIAGAGRLQTLVRIGIPSILPAVLSAVAIAAITVASAFEAPVMIGRPAGIHTYMSTIYRSVAGPGRQDYNLAAAYAALYLVLMIGLLLMYMRATRSERRFAVITGSGYSRARTRMGKWRWALLAVVLLYFWFSFGQLLLANIMVSILPFYTVSSGNPFETFSLSNWENAFAISSVGRGITTSLSVGLLAAISTVLAGSLIVWISLKTRMRFRRGLELVATLPVALPSVVFGMFVLTTILFVPGLVTFYVSPIPMVIALTVAFLPYSVRILSGALIQVHDDLIDSARISGAGQARGAVTIAAPLVRVALFSAFIYIFANAFRELGSIVLLVPPNMTLLPTLIFVQWEQGQNFGLVAALNVTSFLMSSGLLAVGAVVVWFGARWRRVRAETELVPVPSPPIPGTNRGV